MNVKSIFLVGTLACAALFTACDDDDNDDILYSNIPDKAITNLSQLYPDARQVEWDIEKDYFVADFHDGKHEVEAWFDQTGAWIMSETDITYNELPKAVINSFESSLYASWRIDDVDLLEQSGRGNIYVLDAESGEQEMTLHYSENGDLINEVPDGNQNRPIQPTPSPDAITNLIQERYPNATILEIDTDNQYTEVDILDNRIHKEVIFDAQEQWLYTEWEIRQTEVPAIVMNAFNASEYANYRIDDIHCVERTDGLYYAFDLELGDRDYIATFDAEGNLIK